MPINLCKIINNFHCKISKLQTFFSYSSLKSKFFIYSNCFCKLFLSKSKKFKNISKEKIPNAGICFVITNAKQLSQKLIIKNAIKKGYISGKTYSVKLPKSLLVLGADFFPSQISIRESIYRLGILHSGIDLSMSACKVLMLEKFWNKKPESIHKDDKLVSMLAPSLVCPHKNWLILNYHFYYTKTNDVFSSLLRERVSKDGLVVIPISSSRMLPVSFFTSYSVIYL